MTDEHANGDIEARLEQLWETPVGRRWLFADTGNDLIRAYVPSSGHVINLAGSVVDDVPKAGFNGDGHWADETELDHPQGVTPTRDGLFIVADSGNKRLRRFGPGASDETSRR